ncbi:hypothetical protein K9O30_20010 [Clostridium bowmanii]|uniref:hypothetical protein n=1 Tax=Clostridium bowmanii TaxID=132925 RepID=UPI001C0B5516|nr:hypothetical protein [Clostridium bowmanii]MBU3191790.1 hypothetical protein [Clostridium bowmanii]MCA1075963.1 hypothetical protein [Clostridium bowmanii]
MKSNKFLKFTRDNFHIYKNSCTMFLWVLSAILNILGNTFGMIYLVLAFLPIVALAILLTNERKNTDLQ